MNRDGACEAWTAYLPEDDLARQFGDGAEIDLAAAVLGHFGDDHEAAGQGDLGQLLGHGPEDGLFVHLLGDGGDDPGPAQGVGYLDHAAFDPGGSSFSSTSSTLTSETISPPIFRKRFSRPTCQK